MPPPPRHILRRLRLADLVVSQREIVLPDRIGRRGLGDAIDHGEAVALGLQRGLQVALGGLDIAHLAIGNRQIVLPGGVAGIGLGKFFDDGEIAAVGRQRVF